MKKLLCAILSSTLLAASAVPAFAAETTDSMSEKPVLEEGTYAPNQVVVMFRDSAIDTGTVPKKGDLEPVGANFGEMPAASSSEKEALSAADEEVYFLKKKPRRRFCAGGSMISTLFNQTASCMSFTAPTPTNRSHQAKES